jgi:peptide/nickel transport system permease protein
MTNSAFPAAPPGTLADGAQGVAPVPLAGPRFQTILQAAQPVLGRVGSGILVLWAAVTLAFLALQLAPGDTVDILLGDQARTPDVVKAVTEEWGLDKPLLEQYLSYIGKALTGDFGTSYVLQKPVGPLIFSQIGPTLQLTGAALVVAVVTAVLSAVFTAGRRWPRRIASTVELVLVSIPSFWLGIVLLAIFSFSLKLFPVSGDKGLPSLILPALAVGLSIGATLGQVLREGMEKALHEPFAISVRARGVRDVVLRFQHALRHAALPAVTLAGWTIGGLLGGAVVTEQVFGRPGLGQVTVAAVLSKDLPVVLAVAVLSAVVYVVVSTVVDLLYLIIDPRLRTQTG